MNKSRIRNLNFVFVFSSINNFFFNNVFKIRLNNKLILSSTNQNIKFSNSSFYFKSMALHETLTGKKPFLINFNKFIKKKKYLKGVFTCQNVLRGSGFYNFLYFFVFFVMSNFHLKFIKVSKNLNLFGNYYFCIKNASVFPGTLDYFYKWPYKINFFFIIRLLKLKFHKKKSFIFKFNKIFILNFLRNFGLFN